eukprot:SAG31_NODE_13258_length_882_cov_0.752235_1_plen_22_part_10
MDPVKGTSTKFYFNTILLNKYM